MIINNGTIWVTLTNDSSNTQPDVLKSEDNGQSFVLDTAGLGIDAFGTDQFVNLTVLNGTLYGRMSSRDIYKKTLVEVQVTQQHLPLLAT